MYYCCLFVLQLIFLSVVLNLGFPGGKESTCQVGEAGSILGSGRSLGEKMTTHSSILVWEIPLTEEPDRLLESHRIGHELATNNNNV